MDPIRLKPVAEATSFPTSSSGLFREKPWGRGCLVPRVLSFHLREDLGNKVRVSRGFCNEFSGLLPFSQCSPVKPAVHEQRYFLSVKPV